jgi:hypothetical protein
MDQLAQPAWATLTIWLVVNALNLLQAIGFVSRVRSGTMAVNHALGYVVIALALPAAVAGFALFDAGVLHWVGGAVFICFAGFLLMVDYVRPVEFRSPRRPSIVVPFLILFFGSILLMGLPMYTMIHDLWLITVATTLVMLGSMGYAMRHGVG